jgi:hypothetical protein
MDWNTTSRNPMALRWSSVVGLLTVFIPPGFGLEHGSPDEQVNRARAVVQSTEQERPDSLEGTSGILDPAFHGCSGALAG